MAASNPLVSAPVLSQKQRRAAQRKERRKRKRQALAQARHCGLNDEPDCDHEEEEINDEDEEAAEAERLQLHEQWIDRERRAQDEFRIKCEREEAARQRKEEEERMIKEEWEEQQRREKEEKEQKQQEKRDREEAVQKMLDEAENQLDKTGPWMNPEAPATEKSENFGTERDAANCPFFLKTGSCRFGDRCSRKHVYPTSSPTLLIRSMFMTFGMEESRRDDYDIDACLEHSEEELHESFLDFYHDVLPEFKSIGKVIQFKVSCNYEPHLRGNVYVQFDTEEQCRDALVRFNGRWYAGRQLHCEICPVTRWKNAICGLFDRHRCPKGKHCNFLHVFRNPGNEFWEADRDLHMSPDRSVRTSRRDSWYSERHSERSWRQRHGSRSPLRSERSHRQEDNRSRDRTEDRWTSRSRHSDRRTERSYLSRNGDRSRSRSRDRNRSRDKYRDRNEDRERDEDAQRKRSRSLETEKSRKSKEKRSRKTSNDESNTRHRHKHKKNKKKSKKSKKKKSRLSEDMTSSGESDDEKSDKETEDKKESDKETEKEMEKCLTPIVAEKMNETELNLKTRDIASETFGSDVKPEPSVTSSHNTLSTEKSTSLMETVT